MLLFFLTKYLGVGWDGRGIFLTLDRLSQ